MSSGTITAVMTEPTTPEHAGPNLDGLTSTTTTTPTTTALSPPLEGWEIGLIVGVLLAVLLVAAIVAFYLIWKKKKQFGSGKPSNARKSSNPVYHDTTAPLDDKVMMREGTNEKSEEEKRLTDPTTGIDIEPVSEANESRAQLVDNDVNAAV